MMAELQEFCNIVQGGRHKKSGKHFVERGYPAYGAGGMNGFLPDFEFEHPGIVLSSIGARCGKCFLPDDGPWSSLANTQVIIPDPEQADIRFIWYQLNNEASWMRRGTGQPYIRPADVKTRQVYFPPLSEQRRIVALLDKAESIRFKRKQTIKLTDTLLNSIFFEMFGDLGVNSLGWKTYTVAEILKTDPQNGLYRPSSDYGSGTKILRIDGFYDGYLVKDRPLKQVKVDAKSIAKYRLENGDIIINRVNSREYLGKSALVEELVDETVFESNMMRFRVDEVRINPRFFVDQLQTRFIKRQILRASKDAVNQSSINQTDVRNLEVRVPSIQFQEKYAAIVAQKTKNSLRHADAISASNDLFCSLAQRAFIGKL